MSYRQKPNKPRQGYERRSYASRRRTARPVGRYAVRGQRARYRGPNRLADSRWLGAGAVLAGFAVAAGVIGGGAILKSSQHGGHPADRRAEPVATASANQGKGRQANPTAETLPTQQPVVVNYAEIQERLKKEPIPAKVREAARRVNAVLEVASPTDLNQGTAFPVDFKGHTVDISAGHVVTNNEKDPHPNDTTIVTVAPGGAEQSIPIESERLPVGAEPVTNNDVVMLTAQPRGYSHLGATHTTPDNFNSLPTLQIAQEKPSKGSILWVLSKTKNNGTYSPTNKITFIPEIFVGYSDYLGVGESGMLMTPVQKGTLPGASGAPVVDQYGKAVGILTGGSRGNPKEGYTPGELQAMGGPTYINSPPILASDIAATFTPSSLVALGADPALYASK